MLDTTEHAHASTSMWLQQLVLVLVSSCPLASLMSKDFYPIVMFKPTQ